MSDSQIVLVFMEARHHMGKMMRDYYRQVRAEYWRELPPGPLRCYLCDKHLKWREKTIDHIVPKSVIYETGLVWLIYDKRNFAPAHHRCNANRGELSLKDLPENIQQALIQKRNPS